MNSLNKIQSVSTHFFRVADSVSHSGVTIPCITGQCGQVDVISQNGYRYKNGFWDKVLSDSLVQQQIANKDYLGTIEHPENDDEYMKTPYEKASHVILKAWVQNGNPFAVIGLLNNPDGNRIKALIDVGHMPGVSTRGLGEFASDDVSQYVTDENYCFLGWDIVKSPNFAELKLSQLKDSKSSTKFICEAISDSLQSSPVFKELAEMHHLKDSACSDYSKQSLLRDMDSAISELQRLKSRVIKMSI